MPASKVFEPLFRPTAKPKARGGWRQQQQYDESDVMHVAQQSHSFIRHVRYWSEGAISGPVLWDQCEGMVLDGMRHPALVRIVGLLGRSTTRIFQRSYRVFFPILVAWVT